MDGESSWENDARYIYLDVDGDYYASGSPTSSVEITVGYWGDSDGEHLLTYDGLPEDSVSGSPLSARN